MRTAIVLFTRDLRVRDQPALASAAREAERIVPLFVLDPAVLDRFGTPNRTTFLLAALADLDASLRALGAGLVLRRGDTIAEVMTIATSTGAEVVFLSEDVSAYAQARERRLRDACVERRIQVRALPGITVIPPGDLTPARGDFYRVFTPYWRKWHATGRRSQVDAPRRLVLPKLRKGRLPKLAELFDGIPSASLARGGEREGRRRLAAFGRSADSYGELRDDLAADGTSHLSPYLHFGCLSPLEVAERIDSEPFVRQLAWRDFYAQLLAARPEASWTSFRDRGDRWRDDDTALSAWKAGLTGYPIVDAGMRQLAQEGRMHNRARLIVASFLAKDLYLDWRLGAAHFLELLVDGDVASNSGNWQWAAGTGVDTRPNRIFNPVTQAKRYDPSGTYVRRYVSELASIPGAAVHEPWKLAEPPPGYPRPIVDHAEAAARFRRLRARAAAAR